MKPHDQFAKNYLEELLPLLGWVEISKENAEETRKIDLYFFSPLSKRSSQSLGELFNLAYVCLGQFS